MKDERIYASGETLFIPDDETLSYPRVCAHRGFSTIAPENSMPAYGAAVALGAEEIELDLWVTKDGEIVSIHDGELDRVSTGHGNVWDHTFEELQDADFGVKHSDSLKGLRIVTFEEILRAFARRTIMNIHVKTIDEYGVNRNQPYDERALEKIVGLVRKYKAEKHVYFMTVNDTLQHQMQEAAPEINRCMGIAADPWNVVNQAIENKCRKVQLFKPWFNQEMMDKAHANGIICNVFWSDDPEEAKHFFDMGADTILSNDFYKVKLARDQWLDGRR